MENDTSAAHQSLDANNEDDMYAVLSPFKDDNSAAKDTLDDYNSPPNNDDNITEKPDLDVDAVEASAAPLDEGVPNETPTHHQLPNSGIAMEETHVDQHPPLTEASAADTLLETQDLTDTPEVSTQQTPSIHNSISHDERNIDPDHEYTGTIPSGAVPTFLVTLVQRIGKKRLLEVGRLQLGRWTPEANDVQKGRRWQRPGTVSDAEQPLDSAANENLDEIEEIDQQDSLTLETSKQHGQSNVDIADDVSMTRSDENLSVLDNQVPVAMDPPVDNDAQRNHEKIKTTTNQDIKSSNRLTKDRRRRKASLPTDARGHVFKSKPSRNVNQQEDKKTPRKPRVPQLSKTPARTSSMKKPNNRTTSAKSQTNRPKWGVSTKAAETLAKQKQVRATRGNPQGRCASFDHVTSRVLSPSKAAQTPSRQHRATSAQVPSGRKDSTKKINNGAHSSTKQPKRPEWGVSQNASETLAKQKQVRATRGDPRGRRASFDHVTSRVLSPSRASETSPDHLRATSAQGASERRASLTKGTGLGGGAGRLISSYIGEQCGGAVWIRGHLVVPTTKKEALTALLRSVEFGDVASIYTAKDTYPAETYSPRGRRWEQAITDAKLFDTTAHDVRSFGRGLWSPEHKAREAFDTSTAEKIQRRIPDSSQKLSVTGRSTPQPEENMMRTSTGGKPKGFQSGFENFHDVVRRAIERRPPPPPLLQASSTELKQLPPRGEGFLQYLVDHKGKVPPDLSINSKSTPLRTTGEPKDTDHEETNQEMDVLDSNKQTNMVELSLIVYGPAFGFLFQAKPDELHTTKHACGAVVSSVSKYSQLYGIIPVGTELLRVNGKRITKMRFNDILIRVRNLAVRASTSQPQTLTLRVPRSVKKDAELAQARLNYEDALDEFSDVGIWDRAHKAKIMNKGIAHEEVDAPAHSKTSPTKTPANVSSVARTLFSGSPSYETMEPTTSFVSDRPEWNSTTRLWSFNRRFFDESGFAAKFAGVTGLVSKRASPTHDEVRDSKPRRRSSIADELVQQAIEAVNARAAIQNRASTLAAVGFDDHLSAWQDVLGKPTTHTEVKRVSAQHILTQLRKGASAGAVQATSMLGVFEPVPVPTGRDDVEAIVRAARDGEYIDVIFRAVPIGILLEGKSGVVRSVVSGGRAEGIIYPGDSVVRIGVYDLHKHNVTNVPALLRTIQQSEGAINAKSPLSIRFFRSTSSKHAILPHELRHTSAALLKAIQSFNDTEHVEDDEDIQHIQSVADTSSNEPHVLTMRFNTSTLGIVLRDDTVVSVSKQTAAARRFRIGDQIIAVNGIKVSNNLSDTQDRATCFEAPGSSQQPGSDASDLSGGSCQAHESPKKPCTASHSSSGFTAIPNTRFDNRQISRGGLRHLLRRLTREVHNGERAGFTLSILRRPQQKLEQSDAQQPEGNQMASDGDGIDSLSNLQAICTDTDNQSLNEAESSQVSMTYSQMSESFDITDIPSSRVTAPDDTFESLVMNEQNDGCENDGFISKTKSTEDDLIDQDANSETIKDSTEVETDHLQNASETEKLNGATEDGEDLLQATHNDSEVVNDSSNTFEQERTAVEHLPQSDTNDSNSQNDSKNQHGNFLANATKPKPPPTNKVQVLFKNIVMSPSKQARANELQSPIRIPAEEVRISLGAAPFGITFKDRVSDQEEDASVTMYDDIEGFSPSAPSTRGQVQVAEVAPKTYSAKYLKPDDLLISINNKDVRTASAAEVTDLLDHIEQFVEVDNPVNMIFQRLLLRHSSPLPHALGIAAASASQSALRTSDENGTPPQQEMDNVNNPSVELNAKHEVSSKDADEMGVQEPEIESLNGQANDSFEHQETEGISETENAQEQSMPQEVTTETDVIDESRRETNDQEQSMPQEVTDDAEVIDESHCETNDQEQNMPQEFTIKTDVIDESHCATNNQEQSMPQEVTTETEVMDESHCETNDQEQDMSQEVTTETDVMDESRRETNDQEQNMSQEVTDETEVVDESHSVTEHVNQEMQVHPSDDTTSNVEPV